MIFKLQPILLEKIWGGNQLKTTFNTNLENIGEVWGISAHVNASNKLNETNKTLRDLYKEERHYFGNYPKDEFPILMKLIDAKEDLSVQVHPNDTYANQYNSLGKEECWYVLDAKNDAEILIGHQAESKDILEKAIKSDSIMHMMKKYPIKSGDYFYIKAGTIHAILKNTLILEVSQSSDITYRLFDYHRLDKYGQKRELHIKQSLDVMHFPDLPIEKTHQNTYFKFEIKQNKSDTHLIADQYGDYIGITKGSGTINDQHLKFGDFFMISAQDIYFLSGNFEYVNVQLVL